MKLEQLKPSALVVSIKVFFLLFNESGISRILTKYNWRSSIEWCEAHKPHFFVKPRPMTPHFEEDGDAKHVAINLHFHPVCKFAVNNGCKFVFSYPFKSIGGTSLISEVVMWPRTSRLLMCEKKTLIKKVFSWHFCDVLVADRPTKQKFKRPSQKWYLHALDKLAHS